MKKVLEGKCVADVEEVKQKTTEALKGIKINGVQTRFEQWKNISIDTLQQMESTVKETEVVL